MKESDKRSDIMQASLDLIAEHGFHGAPMSMIAERAGVGAGTIYRYFENKDVLISDLHTELEVRVVAAVKEDYPEGKPVRERFIHLGSNLLRYFIVNPIIFRFLEQYYNSPYSADARANRFLNKSNGFRIFMDLFEEARTQQIIKDIPLFVHVALTIGPVTSLMRDHILGIIALDDTIILKSIEACWDGIKR